MRYTVQNKIPRIQKSAAIPLPGLSELRIQLPVTPTFSILPALSSTPKTGFPFLSKELQRKSQVLNGQRGGAEAGVQAPQQTPTTPDWTWYCSSWKKRSTGPLGLPQCQWCTQQSRCSPVLHLPSLNKMYSSSAKLLKLTRCLRWKKKTHTWLLIWSWQWKLARNRK